MAKTGYYLFDAGVNYRDDILGINELADDSNIYYRGNLKRRKGYEQRMELATSPSTGQYASSGLQIIDHIKFEDGSTVISLLFMSMLDTGGSTNAISVWQSSGGLPTGTGTTYTPIGAATFTKSSAGGAGQIIPWATGDAFNAVLFDDKVWLALGDNNPYVLFYDGSSWTIHEVPMCQIGNTSGSLCTGSTDGYNIIPGSTDDADNGDWGGAKIVGAANNNIHISDGGQVYYAPSDAGARADYGTTYTGFYDRTSAMRTNDTSLPGSQTLLPNYNYAVEEQLHVTDIEPYKKYVFLYGKDGIVSCYIRGIYNDDYDLVTESQVGVRGKMVATEKGIFFVSKDGVYGFDGETATDLSKKIIKQLEGQNSDLPTNFDQCSLAYHDGFIWVSFPNGVNKEVYIFDPDHIYDDERGDSHAPVYRNIYRQNLINNSNCETTFDPIVNGEINAFESNTTFARSANEAYTGSYAYQIKKTAASGTVGYVAITDNRSSGDMHGLVAGNTYTLSAWVYTGSSAGSMDISEIALGIHEAFGTGTIFDVAYSTAPTAADEWQRLSVTKSLNTGASGVYLEIFNHAGPSADEVFYIDDITLTCLESSGTDHNVGFKNLKEYDNSLYGVNDRLLYQLDAEGMDEKTTAESIGINWKMKSAYHDQENPNTQKTYRQVAVETNEGISDGTTGGAYDFQFAASVEHSTGLEHRGIATGIDMEYTTDVSHVSKTLDIPEGTSGMILDGNNMSIELIGETDRVTPTTKGVDIYGYTLNWDLKDRAFEEVSS